MIFNQFIHKLLDSIDLLIQYHLNNIEISIKWSPLKDSVKWTIPYLDDECTLPINSPLFYLCSSSSSKIQSLNPSFYSYWFLLDNSFYHRLFSHIITSEDHFILLLSLPDGRILALPESPKDSNPIIWYTSSYSYPITILGLNYDLNTNLLDAVLCSTTNSKFPKIICNHFILCEYIGSIIVLNSTNLRRILIDNLIKSSCIYQNNFIYITKNEIRSITIPNLLKIVNEDIINQTKILRFGHFDKLVVDGQEIILYYSNGTIERLNNLLPRSSNSSRINSLSNQIKKLEFLTTTITNLQTNSCVLQRILTKLEGFYQLNLDNCLKFVNYQWKLNLNDQQLRIFQPNDFLLILICHLPTNDIRIYQLNSTHNWLFKINDKISTTFICQPILILRYQNKIHCKLGLKQIILSLQDHIHEEEIEESFLINKLKKENLINQKYHLVLTIRNDPAINFKKLNLNLARKLLIGRMDIVNIECKQQEIKVDTDAGLVDALTIQIILSSTCIRRLMITFSSLIELFYGNKTIEEKNFIKQTDIMKLIDLIEENQKNLSKNSEDLFLNLLQIRIYLSMFRLGSNYTVQVY